MMQVTKLTETTTTITLGWTPVPGCTGYRFSAEKQAKPSHTWDVNRDQVKFAKGSAWYKVEALGVEDAGQYPVAPPPPPPPTGQTFYGAHQDLIYFGLEVHQPRIDTMKAIGATASRSLLLWRNVEKTKGSYDWSRVDSATSKLAAAGMTNVFAIAAWPGWTGAGGDWNYPSNYAQGVSDYAAFCAKCAQRYPGQRWEIWNEPNERYFWVPEPPNASQYVVMFKAAQAAIMQADPTAKVGVGGITGLVNGCCVTGKTFLTQMVQAGCHFDYCGIHPYDGGPPLSDASYDSNFTDVERIKAHCDSLGLPNVKFWLTEWGWNSNSVGSQTQADYIKQSLEKIRDSYPYVEVATYFLDVDTSAYPGFGLHTPGSNWAGIQKPSAVAFKNFMASL